MNTTVLFVENIIIGFQGALWIVLFIARIVGPERMTTRLCKLLELLKDWPLKDWSLLIIIVVIACIYSLGVILGQVFTILAVLIHIRELFRSLLGSKCIKKLFNPEHYLNQDKVEVYNKVGILAPYLQYMVGRIRIAEATMFNIPLIGLGLFLNPWLSQFKWVILVSASVLWILCIVAYGTLFATLEVREKHILDPKVCG